MGKRLMILLLYPINVYSHVLQMSNLHDFFKGISIKIRVLNMHIYVSFIFF